MEYAHIWSANFSRIIDCLAGYHPIPEDWYPFGCFQIWMCVSVSYPFSLFSTKPFSTSFTIYKKNYDDHSNGKKSDRVRSTLMRSSSEDDSHTTPFTFISLTKTRLQSRYRPPRPLAHRATKVFSADTQQFQQSSTFSRLCFDACAYFRHDLPCTRFTRLY